MDLTSSLFCVSLQLLTIYQAAHSSSTSGSSISGSDKEATQATQKTEKAQADQGAQTLVYGSEADQRKTQPSH